MEIKITLTGVSQNGMVAGAGECTPNEPWLMKHVQAIAEEYAERMASQSTLTQKITRTPVAPVIEDEDERVYCPECEYSWNEEDVVYNRDGNPICPDCKCELEKLPTCPHCGELVAEGKRLKNILSDGTEVEYCPECGALVDEDEWE